MWDWDEALFCLGMQEYDISQHHPHPPGFPAYIAMGRLLRLVISSDFRALQTVNMIAAVLVFPAIFLFARELRVRFPTAVVAGLLFAFFPNVWFFGGTAFSDVPSIVLVLFAATFLLRGRYHRNAYWLGTLLLAIAIGIRPQNLLIGLVPGVLATLRRRPYEIVVALLIGVVICTACFGGAIYATGSYDTYMRSVRHHGDYIARIDSFRAPTRPPLWRLADRFFVKQYQMPLLSIITTLFVLASMVGSIRDRSRAMALNALTFGAFAIFAWLMLDRFSVSRFSIGYQPMFALFAADGIARVARGVRRELIIGGGLIACFIVYTAPALQPVRNEIAPTVSATQTAMRKVDPARDQLYVAYSMVPFFQYYAPGVPFVRVMDDGALPLSQTDNAWLLAEITESEPEGFFFHRDRGRLWNIARRHYFEVFLKKLTDGAQFVSGWHGAEKAGMDEWRWMTSRSVTSLPPARGRTQLRLLLNVPSEALPYRPKVTVKLNGRVLETLDVKGTELQLDYRVMPVAGRNTLELSIDDARPRESTISDGDGRELRMSLRFLSWAKA
ncbi:MAG TPA: hypothetical protein VF111_11960 [Thermoanaerobaculia bacterium]